jgi:macrolide phosphotransferase
LTDLHELAGELGLRPVELATTGSDFLVLHAEDGDGAGWILRAPRREWPLQRMGPERALLDLIADRLPVAVPRWRPEVEHVAVYRTLPGVVDETPSEEYFEDVAGFLAALHAIPPADAARTGIEVREPDAIRAAIAHKIHRFRAELGLEDALWRHWQEWLDDDDPWPPRSLLVHSDIKPANTLVDNGRLSGVIDWTDALVGDPGADFRRLVQRFGRLDELLEAYERHGGQTWPGMRRHIEERVRMAPVDTGLYGIDSGQDRYVRAALERLASVRPAG